MEIIIDYELRQGENSFKKIAKIQEECINCADNVIIINMVNAKFINPSFLTIIGSLIEIDKKNKKCKTAIAFDDKNRNNIKSLKDTGIIKYYTKKMVPNDDSVNFKVITDIKDAIVVADDIISHAPIRLSIDLYGYISSAIMEVINNSFEHGIPKRVYCCGNYDSTKTNFVFSIYDDGVGIPQNVRDYLGQETKTDEETLKWALEGSNSTRKNKESSYGAGLKWLEKLSNSNKGKIFIISGNAVCKIENNSRKFYKLDNKIKGTLFIMSIRSTNNTYIVTNSKKGGN